MCTLCVCLVHTKLAGIHFALCIALCTALCAALCNGLVHRLFFNTFALCTALCRPCASPLFAQAQERMAAQGAHKPLHKAKVLEKTLCGLVQAPISQTLCTLVFRVLALCNLVHALCAIFLIDFFLYNIVVIISGVPRRSKNSERKKNRTSEKPEGTRKFQKVLISGKTAHPKMSAAHSSSRPDTRSHIIATFVMISATFVVI